MIGVLFAVSRAAIIAGAVLASVLVASASLRASLLILGAVAWRSPRVVLACADSMRSTRSGPARSRRG